ncbi:hypothetical protein MVEN_00270200 [Mycena venus]|uniref:Uncharacterized protein n=1 Tax=Mycena venus TaxID=2733690 RepID=A0A8H6Z3Y2_9AGAR|nr:hypothetical protein MVEN_00270200 [Mycena venus]
MYDDLIELSRPGLYSMPMTKLAADLLHRQLNHQCGAAVAWALAQLPSVEAQLVVYKLFQRDYEIHGNHQALEFLEMLLQLRPEIISEFLENFSRNSEILQNHPIGTLYKETANNPTKWRTPLSKLQITISGDSMYRWKNWELLAWAGYSAESRLLDLNTTLINAVSKKLYSDPEFFDTAFDLFDFIRYSEVSDLRRTATDQLVACLTISRDSWVPLRIVVDFLSSKAELPMLSTILGYDQFISQSDAPADMESNFMPPGFQFHPQLCEFLREIHLQSRTASQPPEREGCR